MKSSDAVHPKMPMFMEADFLLFFFFNHNGTYCLLGLTLHVFRCLSTAHRQTCFLKV